MNKQVKQEILVVAFGVTLFAALMNLNDVAGFFRTFRHFFTCIFRTAAGVHTQRPEAWHCTAAHRHLSKAERKDS